MPSGKPIHPRSQNQYGTKKSPERIKLFLEELRRGGSPRTAAVAAGINRCTAFDWKQNDPEFAKAWWEAAEEGIDRLEEEARRRAEQGYTNPVFHAGQCVGEIRHFSDTLMAILLKGRRPSVYNADRLELTEGAVKVEKMTKEELIAELRRRGLPIDRIFSDKELEGPLIEHKRLPEK